MSRNSSLSHLRFSPRDTPIKSSDSSNLSSFRHTSYASVSLLSGGSSPGQKHDRHSSSSLQSQEAHQSSQAARSSFQHSSGGTHSLSQIIGDHYLNKALGDRYVIGPLISSNISGDIRSGTDRFTGQPIVVKIEQLNEHQHSYLGSLLRYRDEPKVNLFYTADEYRIFAALQLVPEDLLRKYSVNSESSFHTRERANQSTTLEVPIATAKGPFMPPSFLRNDDLQNHEITSNTSEVFGFPQLLYYKTNRTFTALVHTYVGPNLQVIFDWYKRENRGFSLKTVCLIALELLHRFEMLHSHQILFCDVKPSNIIASELVKSISALYLGDLTLSRFVGNRSNVRGEEEKITMTTTTTEYEETERLQLPGGILFSSINGQIGRSLSYRDDLESLGYLLIYFTGLPLPWERLGGDDLHSSSASVFVTGDKGGVGGSSSLQIGDNSDGAAESATISLRVAKMKYRMRKSLDRLCDKLPIQFNVYFTRIFKLSFNEKPDYRQLRTLFATIIIQVLEEKIDYAYDWHEGSQEEIPKHPFQHVDEDTQRIIFRFQVEQNQQRQNDLEETLTSTVLSRMLPHPTHPIVSIKNLQNNMHSAVESEMRQMLADEKQRLIETHRIEQVNCCGCLTIVV